MNNFKGCVPCVCTTGSGRKRSCEEQNIRNNYYFPTMLPLINQFVASCYECQSMKEKQPTPKVHYPRIPLDTRLMARVSMDIKEMPKSMLGYTCILVCVILNELCL